ILVDCIGLSWTRILRNLLLCMLRYELFWILLDYDQADTASARVIVSQYFMYPLKPFIQAAFT
ncbi:MAG: hypothetical protein M3Q16_02305, partial [Pseudomonadota bacterium]|nr:hypothetical protein [Pseudomonadota bacterium]